MSSKPPSSDDLSLWRLVTRDVKRLLGADNTVVHAPVVPSRPKSPPLEPSSLAEINFGLKSSPVAAAEAPVGLDRRTEDRFRKGKMEIEARLDLHGLTLKGAQPAVSSFIKMQHAAGKRCVLIITGKGQPDRAEPERWYEGRKGQIRENLKHWLDADDLKHLILSISTAKPQHGGAGAFYILLRRQR